jgi:ribosomal protein S18 acetylase RimI-like enzyme
MAVTMPSIVPAVGGLAISVRPAAAEDLPFLREVYISTRLEEVAATGWPPDQQRAFLEMQFHAQHSHYQQHYQGASFDLILLDGEPVGRFYMMRGEEELRVIDIALLPAYRRRGIGSAFLRAACDEAARAGLLVRLYVEQFNPALGLYTRLGFQQIGLHGIYYHMEWRPEVAHA